jgi:tetratricopeptide (TPR) repeat protein
MLALAYFRQDENELALPPARRAVESTNRPKEAWMQLLLALYLEGESYSEAVAVLERILVRFPKKDYWLQLAAIYGRLGDEDRNLAVTELAYTQGFLTQDSELRNLARLYLHHEIPYSAARVLERGLNEKRVGADADVLKLLAQSWLSAREYERAKEPLARAARLANEGDLFLRLAQLHIQCEEWPEAIDALVTALNDENLKDPGRALVLLGVSNVSAERLDAARRAFQRARKHEPVRGSADRWLEHLARIAQPIPGS